MLDLEQSESEAPTQLQLLEIVNSPKVDQPEQFVHLAELWDLLYIFDDRSKVIAKNLEDMSTIHSVEMDNIRVIVKKEGTSVAGGVFKRAGTREKRVLDCIRFMAAQGFGSIVSDGVINTTNQEAKEFKYIEIEFINEDIRRVAKKKFNYSISGSDIAEAITVLSNSNLEISVQDIKTLKGRILSDKIISRISAIDGSHHIVRLHPLLSSIIIKSSQTQLQNVEYTGKPQVTQLVMNRIHLRFTQVRSDNEYHFLLSTFYKESMPENWPTFKGPDIDHERAKLWQKIKKALDSLKKDGVIAEYNYENRTHEYRGKDYWDDKLITLKCTEEYVRKRISATVATRQLKRLGVEKVTTNPQNVLESLNPVNMQKK